MKSYYLDGMFFLSLIALLCCHGPAPAKAAALIDDSGPAQTSDSVPFRYDPPQRAGIVVQACIDGGPPLPYLVDTGLTAPVLLAPWAARQSHLHLTALSGRLQPGNSTVSVAQNQKFQIVGTDTADSVEFTSIPLIASAVDLAIFDRYQVAGVIGMPLLQMARIRIDFTAKIMSWELQPSPPDASDTTTPAFELQKPSDTPAFFVTLPANAVTDGVGEAEAGGTPETLLLDTGAQYSVLPASIMSRLHPSEAHEGLSTATDGEHLCLCWLVPDFSLGGMEAPEIELETDPFSKPRLGMDLLSRYEPVLDFPNRRLWLRPRRGALPPPHRSGFVGLQLSEKDVVLSVAPHSPAADAGVTPGMVLLSVDSPPRDGVPLSTDMSVAGEAGTTAATLWLRTPSGEQRTIRVPRLGDDNPATFLPVGVRLRPANFGKDGYGVSIEAVLCGSRAYAAGLRAGDVLRTIGDNKLLTKTLDEDLKTTLPYAEAHLGPSPTPLTLSVRPLGADGPETVTLPAVSGETAPASPPTPPNH